MKIKIPFIAEIIEPNSRENFRFLQDLLRENPIIKSEFRFFSKSFSAPSYPATLLFEHKLVFKPTDLIQTSIIGTGVATWNYYSFTQTNASVTITAACTVRFFLGRYEEI